MEYEIVSAFAAKTHLSQLLGEVQNGKHFMITKHNEPVAMLVPLERERRRPIHEVIKEIEEFNKKNTLGKDLTINDLKNEGSR